jgi:hypothetical protein
MDSDMNWSKAVGAIWNALKLELANNPFRSFLAFLQTFTILIGVSQYMWELWWNPPTTQLNVPLLQLLGDPDGSFRGEVIISADGGPPTKTLEVRIFGVNDDMTIYLIRTLNNIFVASGQADTVARVKLENPPRQLLFCFRGKNTRGASLVQRGIVDQDTSALGELGKKTSRSYRPIPQADLPQQPICP